MPRITVIRFLNNIQKLTICRGVRNARSFSRWKLHSQVQFCTMSDLTVGRVLIRNWSFWFAIYVVNLLLRICKPKALKRSLLFQCALCQFINDWEVFSCPLTAKCSMLKTRFFHLNFGSRNNKNKTKKIIRNIHEELLYVSMKVKKGELQIHEGTSRYNLGLRGYKIVIRNLRSVIRP